MFVARCEHFPELAMAESSPQKAYDGLMAMIEKVWVVEMEEGEEAKIALLDRALDRKCGLRSGSS